MGRRLDRSRRIRRREEFSEFFVRGRRLRDERIMLLVRPAREPLGRMGVAVARRHGRAVDRNRVKRLCREAFRLVRDDLPGGWDFLLVPRVGLQQELAGLMDSLRTLGGQLKDRCEND